MCIFLLCSETFCLITHISRKIAIHAPHGLSHVGCRSAANVCALAHIRCFALPYILNTVYWTIEIHTTVAFTGLAFVVPLFFDFDPIGCRLQRQENGRY